jgi:5-methylcytosine-specific restriction endonuclease McrBC regulatory subunit McrC
MSETVRHEYGETLCPVQENGKLIVEGCDPETIEEELRSANFFRDGSRLVKEQSRFLTRTGQSDESKSLRVLSVRIVDDTLHVKPFDTVGIVRLVPGMSVQIEPKVSWEQVIQMLLTIYEIDRTQSYYGVPLEEVLSADIKSSSVVAILAINYLHGLQTIRREGFLRDINIQRRNGFEGLGSIDVEQTLMNQASGNPDPTWIETEVEYTNPINSAVHMAGKLLLRLLHQDQHGGPHPRKDMLLSMIHKEVKRMEDLGIRSSQKEIGEYRRLSLRDLPRQRHYYHRAFHTSQWILSSTLLGQGGGSSEQLLVDYALNMNMLFQDYSQKVLEQKIQSLCDIDHLDQVSGIECKYEPLIYPFDGNDSAYYQPDHLLTDGKETLAVLDSKYYQEGKNPANDTGSRSRMFAYAYLKETDRMAFLCPQYHSTRLPVKHTQAELEIVSPDEGFSCNEYESLLENYLLETLAIRYPEINIFDAVDDGYLCLSGASDEDLVKIHDTTGIFSIGNPATFADRVISAIRFSSYAPNKTELDDGGTWTKRQIKRVCKKTYEDGRPKYPQHETTCVPVYNPDGDSEHGTVTLYFIKSTEEGVRVSTERPLDLV